MIRYWEEQVEAKIAIPFDLKEHDKELLDKVRSELHANAEMHDDGQWYLMNEWIDEIFDKYKAETEDI